MSILQQFITIGLCTLATVFTRFISFIIFRDNKKTPKIIDYIGKYLPGAVFGMLVIYCLKDVNVTTFSYGLPELIAILLTILIHLWRRNTLLSIATGTISYMLLIQFVFH